MFEKTAIAPFLVLATMEPSRPGTAENTSNQEGARPHDQARWAGEPPMKRTVRTLLGVEAASFLLAAMVHAGGLIHGFEHHEAMIAESAIGTVLLVGLAMTWARPRSTFSVAAGVQVFALLGTLVGIWTIIVGIGPRTAPDIVYHVVIVFMLVVGIWLAWQARGTESG